jgi:hypothetical protein
VRAHVCVGSGSEEDCREYSYDIDDVGIARKSDISMETSE